MKYRVLQNDELMHYGVPGMKWGQRRARDKNITGEASGLYRRGEGLGTRPVGEGSDYTGRKKENRPKAREKNVTGKGKAVYRRGESMNIGSVAPKETQENRPSSVFKGNETIDEIRKIISEEKKRRKKKKKNKGNLEIVQ